MGLGGKKRELHRAVAARGLEGKLDNMRATKGEREAARAVFKTLLGSPAPPPLVTCVRRAVGSVVRSRKLELIARESSPDQPSGE